MHRTIFFFNLLRERRIEFKEKKKERERKIERIKINDTRTIENTEIKENGIGKSVYDIMWIDIGVGIACR